MEKLFIRVQHFSSQFYQHSFLAHDSPQMFPCLTLPKILSRGDGTTADDDASSTLLNLPQRHFGLKALPPEPPLANVILCTGSHVKRLRPDLDITPRDVWTKPFLLGGAHAKENSLCQGLQNGVLPPQ